MILKFRFNSSLIGGNLSRDPIMFGLWIFQKLPRKQKNNEVSVGAGGTGGVEGGAGVGGELGA